MVIKVSKPTNQVVNYIDFALCYHSKSLLHHVYHPEYRDTPTSWSYHTAAISELMIQTQISPCYACSCFLKSNLIHILIDNSKISRAIVQHFVINSVLI